MTFQLPVLRRMGPRDPSEPHRVATTLELLFDLTFVVAVARAAAQLGHAIVEGNAGDGVVGYLTVFFAIWWAWMNFTWFASAYDCDDALYRVLTLVQMSGVLVLAAGIPAAFEDKDFRVVTFGYVVMRVAMIAQWLRAAAGDPARRRTNLGYAFGILLVQVGWLLRLAVPETLALWAFVVLVAAEIAVPFLTERQGVTPWHPHHIAERYGLFTIIVLGESVTASSNAVSGIFQLDGVSGDLAALTAGGLVLLFSMWWIYFLHDTGGSLEENRHLSFGWGYLHYFVAAAVAAVGACLEAAAEVGLHHEEDPTRAVAIALALAVSTFLILTGYSHGRLTATHVPRSSHAVAAAVLVVSVAWVFGESVALSVLLQGLVVAGLVAYAVVNDGRSASLPA